MRAVDPVVLADVYDLPFEAGPLGRTGVADVASLSSGVAPLVVGVKHRPAAVRGAPRHCL